jgi:C_GCAxxG_C_C family probable redox protein
MSTTDISQRIDRAKVLFNNNYNCSQSVAMAFSDVIGMNEEEILRAMSGFGYGMGGERTVCGAITGGAFVISSLTKDPEYRDDTYASVKKLLDIFKEQNGGTINCLDLIGPDPGPREFHDTCPSIIERVIRIVEEINNA